MKARRIIKSQGFECNRKIQKGGAELIQIHGERPRLLSAAGVLLCLYYRQLHATSLADAICVPLRGSGMYKSGMLVRGEMNQT